MWRWASSRTVVPAIAVALFGVCCLLPVASLLTIPFSRPNADRVIEMRAGRVVAATDARRTEEGA
jgi:hypothetical protein